jgi:hypothetical protein
MWHQKLGSVGSEYGPRALANLRRKRLYIHRQLERLERAVATLRRSLEETEAAIYVFRHANLALTQS